MIVYVLKEEERKDLPIPCFFSLPALHIFIPSISYPFYFSSSLCFYSFLFFSLCLLLFFFLFHLSSVSLPLTSSFSLLRLLFIPFNISTYFFISFFLSHFSFSVFPFFFFSFSFYFSSPLSLFFLSLFSHLSIPPCLSSSLFLLVPISILISS